MRKARAAAAARAASDSSDASEGSDGEEMAAAAGRKPERVDKLAIRRAKNRCDEGLLRGVRHAREARQRCPRVRFTNNLELAHQLLVVQGRLCGLQPLLLDIPMDITDSLNPLLLPLALCLLCLLVAHACLCVHPPRTWAQGGGTPCA